MSHAGHSDHHGDQSRGPGFEVQIERHEGSRVRALVELHDTVPPGGATLSVLYDTDEHKVIEVVPWRNLGTFVIEELERLAGVDGAHH